MKTAVVLFLSFVLACSTVSPLQKYRAVFDQYEKDAVTVHEKASKSMRGDEKEKAIVFEAYLRDLENARTKLKNGYSEIVGSRRAFSQWVDITWQGIVFHGLIELIDSGKLSSSDLAEVQELTRKNLAPFDQMSEFFANNPTAAPNQLAGWLRRKLNDVLTERNNLYPYILDELRLAEIRATQSAERTDTIVKTVALLGLTALALGLASIAGRTSYPPNDTASFGPYTVTRAGPNTTVVTTPGGRIYTCTHTGSITTVVNCF